MVPVSSSRTRDSVFLVRDPSSCNAKNDSFNELFDLKSVPSFSVPESLVS